MLHTTRSQRIAFFTLCTLGQTLLAAFLLTVCFAKSVSRRDVTVLNLSWAMLFWGIGANLLLYAGHFTLDYQDHEPPLKLCIAQAVVIYTTISMSATSVFCLVLHLWFSVHASNVDRPSPWRGPFLWGLPHVVGVAMFIFSVVRGVLTPDTAILARDGVYCSIGRPVGAVSSSVCGLFILFALILEVHLAITVLRRGRSRRMTELPRDFVVRLIIYSAYAVFTLIAALLLLFVTSVIPFIFMSSLPLVVFILFGTGPDILRVWFCQSDLQPLGSHGESTELTDRTRKEGGPTTYLTTPYSVMSGSAWETSRA